MFKCNKKIRNAARSPMKRIFNFLATWGIMIIVRNFINTIIPPNIHPIKRIAVVISEYVLSDILAEMISDRADASFEDLKGNLLLRSCEKHII